MRISDSDASSLKQWSTNVTAEHQHPLQGAQIVWQLTQGGTEIKGSSSGAVTWPDVCRAHHVQLPLLLEQAGDGHAGEHSGGQGEVGVDDGPVLPVPVVRQGRVEAGPEHPQE